MCVSWLSEQLSGQSANFLKGKSLNKCCLLLLFFLCLILPEVVISADSTTMASVNLGFELNAMDRDKNWVSENGVFAFDFLEIDGDGDDDNMDDVYVVGIRYNNLGNRGANIPVWTVGGGIKVNLNTIFGLDLDGKLILMNNSSGIIWSSNTSTLGVQKATLLNNGNLVLLNSKDEVMWQSFNSPTTTLLPNQSLHYPQNLRAPPTRSVSSYYILAVSEAGELELVWEHNVTYWRSHFSSKEARFDSSGVLGLYDDRDHVVWSVSPKDYGDSSVTLRHLRIDQDGNLRIYSWDNVSRVWRAVWQAAEDQCDVFGSCGLYSVCGYNSSGPVCDCIDGSDSLGGPGCKKMTDLGNCRMHTSMMEMKQTVLYGLYPSNDIEMLLGEAACKGFCSNDTSCIAATSMNDGSGRCTIKKTSFISGYRTSSSIHAVSFLKVCSVPQAAAAANHQGSISSSGEISSGRVSTKKLIGAIALIVTLTLLVIVSIQILVFWFLYHRRKIKVRTRIPFGKDAQMNPHYSILIRLSFEEIKELTNNFANQLGASVFKGALPNKTPIVAKVLKDVVVSEKEFRVTVSTLSGTHHRNLVSVKGFCFEQGNKCLLYEYVQNGSLDKWLFNPKRDHNNNSEQIWQQKVDVALGVARAIAYLHSECQKCITHGNLKLENVLLDENLAPKVTDFGLEELHTKNAASSSESPSERDIYMLGQMFLQIVTCKREIRGEDMQKVLDEVNQEHKLVGDDNLDAIERIVRISFWCMQSQPFLRPSIGEVVKVLEGTLSVDRPPSSLCVGGHRAESMIDTEIEAEEC